MTERFSHHATFVIQRAFVYTGQTVFVGRKGADG
jgi:hypothetical protein